MASRHDFGEGFLLRNKKGRDRNIAGWNICGPIQSTATRYTASQIRVCCVSFKCVPDNRHQFHAWNIFILLQWATVIYNTMSAYYPEYSFNCIESEILAPSLTNIKTMIETKNTTTQEYLFSRRHFSYPVPIRVNAADALYACTHIVCRFSLRCRYGMLHLKVRIMLTRCADTVFCTVIAWLYMAYFTY